MRKFALSLAIVTGFLAMTGCGDSGTNKNVAENAVAKAIADYEAEEKARSEAMKESMKANPPTN